MIKPVLMHTNADEPDRIVWCVVAPSGRVIAERMTKAAAERVAVKQIPTPTLPLLKPSMCAYCTRAAIIRKQSADGSRYTPICAVCAR